VKCLSQLLCIPERKVIMYSLAAVEVKSWCTNHRWNHTHHSLLLKLEDFCCTQGKRIPIFSLRHPDLSHFI